MARPSAKWPLPGFRAREVGYGALSGHFPGNSRGEWGVCPWPLPGDLVRAFPHSHCFNSGIDSNPIFLGARIPERRRLRVIPRSTLGEMPSTPPVTARARVLGSVTAVTVRSTRQARTP
jgi:hypothetical protein